jgi:hypothetical protein
VVAFATEGTGSGNVIAYNYLPNDYHVNNQTDYPRFTLIGHAGGSWHNLFEGNVVNNSKFRVDNYFGTQHAFTLYRNKISPDPTIVSGTNIIDMERPSANNNIVGNVFGTTGFEQVYECEATVHPCGATTRSIYRLGYQDAYVDGTSNHVTWSTMLRHANWDSVTNGQKWCTDSGEPGCQGGDANHTVPQSLYLSSKPSWYGNCTWPPIDPNGPTVHDIPAKLRYEGKSCSGATYHPADTNQNGCVSLGELVGYTSGWKAGSGVTFSEVINAISEWRKGC